jgi:hypothetical protein
MKVSVAGVGFLSLLLAACDRGPDAVIPPPWHPASAAAPVAPPIRSPRILDEPADTKPVPVRDEPSPGTPVPKPSQAPAPKGGGGHGQH